MLPQNTILGRVEGVEVYDDYEGPKIFLAENDLGVQFLVYWCGVDDGYGYEWLYLPITTKRLTELKRADIDFYTVFSQPESDLYLVTTSAKLDGVILLDVGAMRKSDFPSPDFYIEHVALWED